jgi:hypothetical protein
LPFNVRTALGIGLPVLLGSALAAGVTAFPANATSYQDTALSAGSVTDGTYAGTTLTATNATATTIAVSGSGVSTWSLHGTPPTGVAISSTTAGKAAISYTGSAVSNPPAIIADAADSNGNAEALVISVVIAANSIQKTGTPTLVKVTNLIDTNNSNGTVTFSATTSTSSLSYAESNLPTGLTSGNPLTYSGGTAAPGTYNGVKATATDGDGAVLNGTFTLTVTATTVTTSNVGDYVNKFGNGFDSYRQHRYAGALIVGWPATQSDPATHFILDSGTHPGAVRIEYAPGGSGSGLCVSDPGGGWGSDPLRDGLILANCNTGPWQQFIRQSDGTLRNVATGLYVNPDGTGAQLRGESSTTSWGGSSYNWKDETSLP